MHMFVCVCVCVCICILLPGNQFLISKYLARRGVVVSRGGAMNPDGNRLQLLCACVHFVSAYVCVHVCIVDCILRCVLY